MNKHIKANNTRCYRDGMAQLVSNKNTLHTHTYSTSNTPCTPPHPHTLTARHPLHPHILYEQGSLYTPTPTYSNSKAPWSDTAAVGPVLTNGLAHCASSPCREALTGVGSGQLAAVSSKSPNAYSVVNVSNCVVVRGCEWL